MKINIFSGARRLALVLAALAALIALGVTAFHEPYVSLSYTVAAPNAPFIRTQEDCPEKGATHFLTASASQGESVFVTLCLLPTTFGEDNAELIPYKIDSKGMIWGAEEYSTEVFAYEKELERRLRLSPADLAAVESEKSVKYWQQLRETLLYLALGLAVFWLLITAIGWVVRGFVGIPFGKDSKVAVNGGSEH